ncbi:DgyrCDS1640 [Dimorphilus gyrociliatus]|uniref:DgyrCDS1640 n=1 Tax=Dimorphilus gyrociliatus TaxID=2664684 RepID=A0A7I8V7Z9_9ANNE|nr:DgyrCDS1640 [Dimorphilus gyrociliatus]
MEWIFYWIFSLATILDARQLVYLSPGDKGKAVPGIYGGNIDRSTASNLRRFGFNCTDKGVTTRFFTVDDVTGEMLIWAKSETGYSRSVTLFKLPDCTNCNSTKTILFKEVSLVGCELTSIGIYDSEIYIVCQKISNGYLSKHQTLEVRHLTGCEKRYPIIQEFVRVSNCSKLISAFTSAKLLRGPTLTPSELLKVLKDPYGHLNYIVLVRNVTLCPCGRRAVLNSFTADLWLINERGWAKLLHSENLREHFLNVELREAGGLDYRDGKLCWSAIESILCAEWRPGEAVLKNIRTVLPKRFASTACSRYSNWPGSDEIVTGIAIKEVFSGHMIVMFGCLSQIPYNGGAGVVNFTKGRESEITELRDEHGLVRASSMYLTNDCKKRPIQTGIVYGISNSDRVLYNCWLLLLVACCVIT